jgi:hypothetical protein
MGIADGRNDELITTSSWRMEDSDQLCIIVQVRSQALIQA